MTSPLIIDLGKIESRTRAYWGRIVSAAVVLPVGEFHQSNIPCRRKRKGELCTGRMHLCCEKESDTISFRCENCGDMGTIINWKNSRWDLKPAIQQGTVIPFLQARRKIFEHRGPRRVIKVYELGVELIGGPIPLDDIVSRRIVISSEQNLVDLHMLIRKAYDREQDAQYEFMFGAPYELDSRCFAGPLAGDGEQPSEASQIVLGSLALLKDQTFGYLFDFADEWIHRVVVLSANDQVVGRFEPRVLDRIGDSPPQQREGTRLPWDEPIVWEDLDEEYPLSSIYGVYLADESQNAALWRELDEVEQLLLVMEGHDQALPKGHPPVDSPMFHALVHVLAETLLADHDERTIKAFNEHRAMGLTRHDIIHRIGNKQVREMLETASLGDAMTEQARPGKKNFRRPT